MSDRPGGGKIFSVPLFKPVFSECSYTRGDIRSGLTAAASRKDNEPGPKEGKKPARDQSVKKEEEEGEKKLLSHKIKAEEEKALTELIH